MNENSNYCTKKELAQRLKVSLSTINNLIKRGVPHIKMEKAVRFDFDEVINWLKEKGK